MFGDWGLGFRVWGLGFKVLGSGFSVQDLGLKVYLHRRDGGAPHDRAPRGRLDSCPQHTPPAHALSTRKERVAREWKGQHFNTRDTVERRDAK